MFADFIAKRHGWLSVVSFGVALVAAGVVVGFSTAFAIGRPPPISVSPTSVQLGFADLVAAVKPAVVNISTMHKAQTQVWRGGQEPFADMFQRFFGQNFPNLQQQLQTQRALGSGFVIDPKGYIVTNNHVIDGADKINVTLTDGTVYAAQVVGRDDKTDLALLKVNASKPLPYVAFGNSDQERVGDWVIAVGNPYGLGGSVSAGVVSATDRDIRKGPYDDYMQIDAPINPGSSGGPLFDQSGHVIGIDTAIYSPSGGSVGVGFAIPSNAASKIIDELRRSGHVSRGWLGIEIQPVTLAIARAIRLGAPQGVIVDRVTKDSPAAKAGIVQGDIITRFDSKVIKEAKDLTFAVAAVSAGSTVPLHVWRDGADHVLHATIKAQSSEVAAAVSNGPPPRTHLGLELAPLGDSARAQLGVQGGAVIAGVEAESPADRSGLLPGDVIIRVGQQDVGSLADTDATIRRAEDSGRKSVLLLIQRNDSRLFLPLQMATG